MTGNQRGTTQGGWQSVGEVTGGDIDIPRMVARAVKLACVKDAVWRGGKAKPA